MIPKSTGCSFSDIHNDSVHLTYNKTKQKKNPNSHNAPTFETASSSCRAPALPSTSMSPGSSSRNSTMHRQGQR